MNKGSEGLHPVHWTCLHMSQIWSMLTMIAPVKKMSNPLMADPIARGGMLVSFLERENNTSLAWVFLDALPHSGSTCLTARTEDKVPFPTWSISVLSIQMLYS